MVGPTRQPVYAYTRLLHMHDDFDPAVSCLAAGRCVGGDRPGLAAASRSNLVFGDSTFDKIPGHRKCALS